MVTQPDNPVARVSHGWQQRNLGLIAEAVLRSNSYRSIAGIAPRTTVDSSGRAFAPTAAVIKDDHGSGFRRSDAVASKDVGRQFRFLNRFVRPNVGPWLRTLRLSIGGRR
jgi:hypothetical protein